MFIAMIYWIGLRPRYWMLIGTLLGYPIFLLCPGDPSALILQGQFFHELQHFMDGMDAGVGQLKELDPGMGGS